MPRSLAERAVDRASLSARSRTSVGRFSVGTEVSVSSAATRHWVNSVSDIYGPDEIEELLADLNRLEFSRLESGHLDPVTCAASPHLDNFDNFDIDGSRGEGLDLVSECGPASPLVPRPRSPGSVSTRSWNSHTHYHQFKAPPADYDWGGSRGPGHLVRPLQAAVCYCDMSVLKSPRTLLRVLVLVSHINNEIYSHQITHFDVISTISTYMICIARVAAGHLPGVSVQPGHLRLCQAGRAGLAPHRQAAAPPLHQLRQRPLLPPRPLPRHIPPSRTPTNGLLKNGKQILTCGG